MNTFILNIDLKISASQLDQKRLGKQRLECADALAMLLGQPSWMSNRQYAYIQKKYRNHPAWQMWKGYEPALIEYGLIVCGEWIGRGCKDTFLEKIIEFGDMLRPPYSMSNPPWLTEEFVSNHRAIMLGKVHVKYRDVFFTGVPGEQVRFNQAKKQWEWYKQFNWSEQPAKRVMINGQMRWPYIWNLTIT